MLHAIEEELILPPDGRLPEKFRPAFGHKVRIVILTSDQTDEPMEITGKRYQTLAVQERVIPSRDEIHDR